MVEYIEYVAQRSKKKEVEKETKKNQVKWALSAGSFRSQSSATLRGPLSKQQGEATTTTTTTTPKCLIIDTISGSAAVVGDGRILGATDCAFHSAVPFSNAQKSY